MSKKILGVSKPSATVVTELYVVPSGKESVVSTLSICNVGSATDYARVYVFASGGSASTSTAMYYDLEIVASDNFQATCGISLAAGSKVVCYSLLGNLTFHLFGDESNA